MSKHSDALLKTARELVRKLQKRRIKFVVTTDMKIRSKAKAECPIVAEANKSIKGQWYSNSNFLEAAEAIGIKRTHVGYIIGAVDRNDTKSPLCKVIRQEFLKLCDNKSKRFDEARKLVLRKYPSAIAAIFRWNYWIVWKNDYDAKLSDYCKTEMDAWINAAKKLTKGK